MAYTIMVVDDSLLARTFMEKALRLSGLPVKEILLAKQGAEALQIMEKNWVDIVFADINMPEMNGIELVHAMHDHKTLRNLPVVIVSTERSETRIRQLEQDGVRAYITKPFTPEKLKQVVDELFRQ